MTDEQGTPTMIASKMVGDLLATFNGAPAAQPPADLNVNGLATGVIPTQAPGPSANQLSVATPPPDPTPAQELPAQPLPAQPLTEDEKRAHAFANLRYENKQLTGQVSDLKKAYEAEQAKLAEESRKAQETARQLEEERRARIEVEEALGRANLAESKEFKARFDSRQDELAHKLANVIVDKTEMTDPVKAEDFARKLMAAPEADVLHAIDNLPSYVQGSIYNLVQEGRQVSAERDEALTNWRATQTGLSEAEARQRAADLSLRRQEIAGRAVAAVSGSNQIPAFFVNEPEFVELRNRRLEETRAFIQTASEDDLANAAVEGMMAPLSYALIDRLQQENDRLRSQIDAMLRTSSPTLRATHGGGYTPPPKPEPTGQAVRSTHQIATDMLGPLFRKL